VAWGGGTKEGRRRGYRTKKTKANEKGHYTQLEEPNMIITKKRMLSVRKGNYWGPADVTADRASER
jgi:hypothetical protein